MVVLILLNYVGKAVVLLLYLAKKNCYFFPKNCEEKKGVKIRFGYFTTKKG